MTVDEILICDERTHLPPFIFDILYPVRYVW